MIITLFLLIVLLFKNFGIKWPKPEIDSKVHNLFPRIDQDFKFEVNLSNLSLRFLEKES